MDDILIGIILFNFGVMISYYVIAEWRRIKRKKRIQAMDGRILLAGPLKK